jgi:hypothetical protein
MNRINSIFQSTRWQAAALAVSLPFLSTCGHTPTPQEIKQQKEQARILAWEQHVDSQNEQIAFGLINPRSREAVGKRFEFNGVDHKRYRVEVIASSMSNTVEDAGGKECYTIEWWSMDPKKDLTFPDTPESPPADTSNSDQSSSSGSNASSSGGSTTDSSSNPPSPERPLCVSPIGSDYGTPNQRYTPPPTFATKPTVPPKTAVAPSQVQVLKP